MSDERMGLRERKKQETRNALSWAAVRLAAERGLDAVRVEDIAAEVCVSPRTFNNYFASKSEAIAARHLERARQIAVELRARPESEPLWEAITNATLARFGLSEGTGEREPEQQWLDGVRLMVSEPALRGEFFKANAMADAELAAAIAERTGTDVEHDLYPRLVSGAVGAAMAAAIGHWLHAAEPTPMAPLLRDALHQLASGLPVP
ncbi:TetR family transcriptional regulator [Saccharopolyspora sp. WRP15-2]|uniref:TetR family transcriptional regulator n=1 Tax=Saccharopolyspora oryzae TaxID=2997343 RepID=A0ABT4VAW1_9PSEU|nr:TetR family transcriptional regulator [Saccharopolyspora oryzae]MDA3630549.1 TetR family transcriptional regulator [Saccharopolyspora oryzae]